MALILKRQNKELMEKQDDRISLATLNERNRIAREIHDNVGHLLSSALLQMGALLAVTKDEKARQPLLTLKATLSEAMDSIRQSVHNLYDESVNLQAQLQELADKFTFCTLEFDYEIQSNPDKRLKYALISIVKEGLSNIVRHSDATWASVALREHPAFYQLVIRDNGRVKEVNMESGIGLKNIESRVEAFHGIMRILSKDGFALFISIPKDFPSGKSAS
ncbi:two-component sensor histidine kinase [Paenibacillus sp. YN15]|nr:two-component sensor histidine kinase [Paenibacillus sp. YN15]